MRYSIIFLFLIQCGVTVAGNHPFNGLQKLNRSASDKNYQLGITYNPWGLLREKGGKYFGGDVFYITEKGGIELGGTYYNKKHEQAIDVGINNDNVDFGTPYWQGYNVHLIKYFKGIINITGDSEFGESYSQSRYGLMVQYSKRNFFTNKDGKGDFKVSSDRIGLAFHLSFKLGAIPMLNFFGTVGAAVGTWNTNDNVSDDPNLQKFFELRSNPYIMPIMRAGINIGLGIDN